MNRLATDATSRVTPIFGGPLTEIGLCAWIGEAAPGDRLEYHRGFLAVDAADTASKLPRPDRVRLKALAGAVHRAFEMRLVHPVQVRLGPDRFAYLAIARPKRRGSAGAKASLPSLLGEAA